MTASLNLASVLAWLALSMTPVAGQNVYRCGDSYGSQPCAGGTVVPTDDPRSAAQRAESRSATQRDIRLADQMESQRFKRETELARELARERAAAAKTAASAAKVAASAAKAAASPKNKKGAKGKSANGKPEVFSAVAPRRAGSAPTGR